MSATIKLDFDTSQAEKSLSDLKKKISQKGPVVPVSIGDFSKGIKEKISSISGEINSTITKGLSGALSSIRFTPFVGPLGIAVGGAVAAGVLGVVATAAAAKFAISFGTQIKDQIEKNKAYALREARKQDIIPAGIDFGALQKAADGLISNSDLAGFTSTATTLGASLETQIKVIEATKKAFTSGNTEDFNKTLLNTVRIFQGSKGSIKDFNDTFGMTGEFAKNNIKNIGYYRKAVEDYANNPWKKNELFYIEKVGNTWTIIEKKIKALYPPLYANTGLTKNFSDLLDRISKIDLTKLSTTLEPYYRIVSNLFEFLARPEVFSIFENIVTSIFKYISDTTLYILDNMSLITKAIGLISKAAGYFLNPGASFAEDVKNVISGKNSNFFGIGDGPKNIFEKMAEALLKKTTPTPLGSGTTGFARPSELASRLGTSKDPMKVEVINLPTISQITDFDKLFKNAAILFKQLNESKTPSYSFKPQNRPESQSDRDLAKVNRMIEIVTKELPAAQNSLDRLQEKQRQGDISVQNDIFYARKKVETLDKERALLEKFLTDSSKSQAQIESEVAKADADWAKKENDRKKAELAAYNAKLKSLQTEKEKALEFNKRIYSLFEFLKNEMEKAFDKADSMFNLLFEKTDPQKELENLNIAFREWKDSAHNSITKLYEEGEKFIKENKLNSIQAESYRSNIRTLEQRVNDEILEKEANAAKERILIEQKYQKERKNILQELRNSTIGSNNEYALLLLKNDNQRRIIELEFQKITLNQEYAKKIEDSINALKKAGADYPEQESAKALLQAEKASKLRYIDYQMSESGRSMGKQYDELRSVSSGESLTGPSAITEKLYGVKSLSSELQNIISTSEDQPTFFEKLLGSPEQMDEYLNTVRSITEQTTGMLTGFITTLGSTFMQGWNSFWFELAKGTKKKDLLNSIGALLGSMLQQMGNMLISMGTAALILAPFGAALGPFAPAVAGLAVAGPALLAAGLLLSAGGSALGGFLSKGSSSGGGNKGSSRAKTGSNLNRQNTQNANSVTVIVNSANLATDHDVANMVVGALDRAGHNRPAVQLVRSAR